MATYIFYHDKKFYKILPFLFLFALLIATDDFGDPYNKDSQMLSNIIQKKQFRNKKFLTWIYYVIVALVIDCVDHESDSFDHVSDYVDDAIWTKIYSTIFRCVNNSTYTF